MRKLFRYGKAYAGNDPELQEGDVFRAFIPVPEKKGAQSGGQSEGPVGGQSAAILQALREKPLSTSDLAEAIGLKRSTGAFRQTLNELLAEGLIEYTLPGKPTSRLQEYRLTPSGQAKLSEAPDHAD